MILDDHQKQIAEEVDCQARSGEDHEVHHSHVEVVVDREIGCSFRAEVIDADAGASRRAAVGAEEQVLSLAALPSRYRHQGQCHSANSFGIDNHE